MVGSTAAMLNILGSALSIWDSKEKTKYQDKKIKLEEEYRNEYNKPIHIPGESGEGKRSDAVLDDIDFRVRLLCDTVGTAIGTKNPKT